MLVTTVPPPTLLQFLFMLAFSIIWTYFALYSIAACVDYGRYGAGWSFIIVFLSPFVAILILWLVGHTKEELASRKKWKETLRLTYERSKKDAEEMQELRKRLRIH